MEFIRIEEIPDSQNLISCQLKDEAKKMNSFKSRTIGKLDQKCSFLFSIFEKIKRVCVCLYFALLEHRGTSKIVQKKLNILSYCNFLFLFFFLFFFFFNILFFSFQKKKKKETGGRSLLQLLLRVMMSVDQLKDLTSLFRTTRVLYKTSRLCWALPPWSLIESDSLNQKDFISAVIAYQTDDAKNRKKNIIRLKISHYII